MTRFPKKPPGGWDFVSTESGQKGKQVKWKWVPERMLWPYKSNEMAFPPLARLYIKRNISRSFPLPLVCSLISPANGKSHGPNSAIPAEGPEITTFSQKRLSLPPFENYLKQNPSPITQGSVSLHWNPNCATVSILHRLRKQRIIGRVPKLENRDEGFHRSFLERGGSPCPT